MPRIIVVGYADLAPDSSLNILLTSFSYLRAGVVGLTSALLLAKDSENVVTVAAKHMPGDYDIQYTSPWAGANYLPLVNYSSFLSGIQLTGLSECPPKKIAGGSGGPGQN